MGPGLAGVGGFIDALPQDELWRLLASPVPTQTMSGLDGAISTDRKPDDFTIIPIYDFALIAS